MINDNKNEQNKNVESKIFNRRKLLILSIFKNSNKWARNVLLDIHNIYRFNDTLYNDDNRKLIINFAFLDGMSTDGTFSTITDYCKNEDIQDIKIIQFDHDDNMKNINKDPFFRYKKLASIRNYIVEQSVSHFNLEDDDYILFIDSDIRFNYNIAHKLIIEMENCGADIIAPMIYIENFREFGNNYFYDTLAFRYIDGSKFDHFSIYNRGIDMNNPNEVSSVGSFYLMKYKVAKSVKYSGEKDSEQVEFCNNARSLGFKIFVSPRLSVLHINLDKYGLEWH